MRLPFVSRAYHEAIVLMYEQRLSYMQGELSNEKDLKLLEGDRYDKLFEQFLDLAKVVKAGPGEVTIDVPLVPTVPKAIEDAILMRAPRGSSVYRQQIEYAVEQQRLGKDEADVAREILTGASTDGPSWRGHPRWMDRARDEAATPEPLEVGPTD